MNHFMVLLAVIATQFAQLSITLVKNEENAKNSPRNQAY